MSTNEELIQRIIDAPQTLTDAEVAAILADPELRDLYAGAVDLGRASANVPDFYPEMELAILHSRLHTPRRWSPLMRAAAILLAIVAFTAIAAVIYRAADKPEAPTPELPGAKTIVTQVAPTDSCARSVNTPLRYDNATLADILTDLSAKYGCTVEYSDDTARSVRLHVSIPADAGLERAIEILNMFDNVDIALDGTTIIAR